MKEINLDTSVVSGCYATAYNVVDKIILNKKDKLMQNILAKLNNDEFETLRDRLADSYMNNLTLKQ